jgi:hypothetical protein
MLNAEIKMTKEGRMPKPEYRSLGDFVIEILSFLRHSVFVIRHFPLSLSPSPV